MRKATATVPQTSFPSTAVRRNGAYIDYDQQFDEANMLEEIIEDELVGERVAVAFAAGVGPRVICIDSGANIFILNFLLAVFTNFVDVGNRFIRTAAAGGQLRVEALFDAGAAAGIRYCSTATASLMPTNIICACNCSVMFDMLDGIMRCRIICKESSHGVTMMIFSLLTV